MSRKGPDIQTAETATLKIAIIGEEGVDPTGMMYDAELRARGVEILWVHVNEMFRDIVDVSGSPLGVHAEEDPFAAEVPDGYVLRDDASVRAADGVMFVSTEGGPYENIITSVLHDAGLTAPNSPHAVKISVDKWATYEVLRDANIAVPRAEMVHTLEEAIGFANQMTYPLVVKEPMGQQGSGVRLAEDEAQLREVLVELELEHQPLMLQHYIECHATDKRVVVIGDSIFEAIERHAKPGEFRTNLALGGTATKIMVEDDEASLVLASVKALGLTLAGMDIARVATALPGREYLAEGQVFCIEANPSPGLKGHKTAPPRVIDMMIERVRQSL